MDKGLPRSKEAPPLPPMFTPQPVEISGAIEEGVHGGPTLHQASKSEVKSVVSGAGSWRTQVNVHRKMGSDW